MAHCRASVSIIFIFSSSEITSSVYRLHCTFMLRSWLPLVKVCYHATHTHSWSVPLEPPAALDIHRDKNKNKNKSVPPLWRQQRNVVIKSAFAFGIIWCCCALCWAIECMHTDYLHMQAAGVSSPPESILCHALFEILFWMNGKSAVYVNP